MRVRQQGITLISFIVAAAVIGALAFAGLKILPFYLEQMKVTSILSDVKSDMDGSAPTVVLIRNALAKRLDIEMVTGITTQDFAIKKSGMGYTVKAQYENRAPYIGNLYLVVVFDEQVEIIR
jgi:Tfp pilus assembly major pilin PilA